ncbi:MAG: hypothetical protein ACXWP5_12475, partial [Bdellovibrionota bacterium]
MWIGFFGLLLMRELSRARPATWRLALWLALSAYFHFEAVILVPVAVVGLFERPWRQWLRRLWEVGWRTGLLLSPWLIYVLAHWELFRVQMDVQFHRLEHANYYLQNFYLFFHSLFLSAGNAEDWPKFLNLGKAIYWALLLSMVWLWARRAARGPHDKGLVVLSAALAGVASSLWLWYTKQEVWFTTPCHTAIWTLAAASVVTAPRGKISQAIVALSGAFATVALIATFLQLQRTPKVYNWRTYNNWISCLDRAILKTPAGEHAKVWQPHVPDVLVELSERHPQMDLTRALDFMNKWDLAWEYSRRADAIVYTTYMTAPLREEQELYEGPERPEDRAKLDNPMGMPFGAEAAHRLPVEQPGKFMMTVCQVGPFWGEAAVRK